MADSMIQPSSDAKSTALAIAFEMIRADPGVKNALTRKTSKGDTPATEDELGIARANLIGRMAQEMISPAQEMIQSLKR